MKKVFLFCFLNKRLCLEGWHFFGYFLFAVEKKVTRQRGDTTEFTFPRSQELANKLRVETPKHTANI